MSNLEPVAELRVEGIQETSPTHACGLVFADSIFVGRGGILCWIFYVYVSHWPDGRCIQNIAVVGVVIGYITASDGYSRHLLLSK